MFIGGHSVICVVRLLIFYLTVNVMPLCLRPNFQRNVDVMSILSVFRVCTCISTYSLAIIGFEIASCHSVFFLGMSCHSVLH